MRAIVRYFDRRSLRYQRWLGVLLGALLVSGWATASIGAASDTEAVDGLLVLIKERLEVAPEVARTKWNTKAPIEDSPREKQIIDGVAKAAPQFGLDPLVAASFFTAQIEASKVVQNALHAQWTAAKQPPFATVADLGKDIRPVLDRLTPAMMQALAKALPAIERAGGRQLLEAQARTILANSPGGEAAAREALAPLLKLSR